MFKRHVPCTKCGRTIDLYDLTDTNVVFADDGLTGKGQRTHMHKDCKAATK